MRTLGLLFVFCSIHASALRLIDCSASDGTRIIFSTGSFSSVAKLAVFTEDRNLSFSGSKQIFMLERLGSSYLVDANNRLEGIRYDNVQFMILDQDSFETSLVIAKVDGCSRREIKVQMKCSSEKYGF